LLGTASIINFFSLQNKLMSGKHYLDPETFLPVGARAVAAVGFVFCHRGGMVFISARIADYI
jgi:hypothetical protein